VTLYNAFSSTKAPNQPQTDATAPNASGGVHITGGTGACTAASYWDIGVRGDSGPTNHGSGFTLNPIYSLLTPTTPASYNSAALHNLAADPSVVSQYCNGSRTPPELAAAGWQVPPGIADATVPNPLFTLSPAATVDEGNNWINLSWGPLALSNPLTKASLGNYALAAGTSPAVNHIPSTASGATGAYTLAPSTDFFGTARKTNNAVDAGAVEFPGPTASLAAIAPNTGAFGNVALHNPSLVQYFLYTNTGTSTIVTTTVTLGDTVNYAVTFQGCVNTTLNPGQTCTMAVVFTPTVLGALNTTLTVNGPAPATVNLTGTGVAQNSTLIPTPPGTAAFGNVAVNGASANFAFTYRNIGAGTFTTTTVTLSDTTNFVLAFNGCNANQLIPNATCAIQVTFTPKSTGLKTATLTVNGPAPASLTLTGTGVTTMAISGPVPVLNPATANLTVKTGVVTVTNTGAGVLTLGATPVGVALATGSGAFVLVTPATGTPCAGGAALAAGTSCTVGVQYTPPPAPASLTSTAVITVADSGAATATQTLTITGN
jgi:hypothetical protein